MAHHILRRLPISNPRFLFHRQNVHASRQMPSGNRKFVTSTTAISLCVSGYKDCYKCLLICIRVTIFFKNYVHLDS